MLFSVCSFKEPNFMLSENDFVILFLQTQVITSLGMSFSTDSKRYL